MKRISIVFFQIVVVCIGISALSFMLWEPHIEGRNINATFFEIYFMDPFLAYAYIASIPFFVGLYHVFKILGYVQQNEISWGAAIRSLRCIRYCAIVIIGCAIVGEVFIILGESDDRAGGIFMGALVILGSVIVASMSVVFERMLQKYRR